ncbi:uncharacterized protein LY89DRAFT_721986 [Mollisia scopiformis]|uniref:Uncharacterized protein n=1 Tax=Mollisia scopiformis TaxID=149040 RepID=A0A194WXC9_MOLSC|nr:uncharacterized protein LY89DRAFT_721986 [Mollisia scopiformis]KUJ12339.1 hypothetical protein LY89DRAFT_721986 [Mollisia scopiformis]
MRGVNLLALLAVVTTVAAVNMHVDFTQACWTVVNESIQQNPSLANETTLQCGQSYSPSTPPALNVNISLPVCIERWPGWQMSDVTTLNQWVGPLVGFLLPALVFVLVIPRNYRVPRGDPFFNKHIIVSVLWLIFAFCLLMLDVLIWIMMVFGLAGLIIVGAIDEGLKDRRILRSIEKAGEHGIYSRAQASYALAVTLVGTIKPREDLHDVQPNGLVGDVIAQICDTPNLIHAKEKLGQLLNQQMSYGIQIGAPVVFYLGPYVYSLFDATSRLGDNDTAHAIAFGLWYGLIVLTATSCCCVVGLNDPSLIEGIFDTHVEKPRTVKAFFSPYESQHRSVWIFNRPWCARTWANAKIVHVGSPDNDKAIHPNVRKILNSKGLSVLSCFLAISAISIICGLAFSISFFTPRIGFGCRATTILCHGASQIILIMCWFYYNEEDERKTQLIKWPVYILSGLLFMFSVFIAIGGTIMQLLGVYRNCICKAGLRFWFDQAPGVVNGYSAGSRLWVSVDQDRNSWYLLCWSVLYLGMGNFMRMKAKTREQIEALR